MWAHAGYEVCFSQIKLPETVIAVTGTNGKTTTKELLDEKVAKVREILTTQFGAR